MHTKLLYTAARLLATVTQESPRHSPLQPSNALLNRRSDGYRRRRVEYGNTRSKRVSDRSDVSNDSGLCM